MISVKNIFCFLTAFIFSLLLNAQIKAGDEFSQWSEGYLDIHHINTGKGESTFFIFPDGTTMLVDAGATQREKPRVTDPKPDGSREPGEWISRYILNFLKNHSVKKIDYALATHFHGDHIGEIHANSKKSVKGEYKLTGLTQVAEYIPFGKIVDRGWPDYDYPLKLDSKNIQNYISFVKCNNEKNGMIAEQFDVGEKSQFKLLNHPEKYPDFEIRNIAANGYVWTGVADNKRNHFPPFESLNAGEYPDENKLSCAFRLSYGKFDYFNGGDLTTGEPGAWEDIETPVGRAAGPVDVCIANHHAFYDAMGLFFLQAVRPRVYIILSWAPSHPSHSVISRMMSGRTYPGPRDLFSTNVMEETHVVIGAAIDKMISRQGHIVIRVNPGGESYMIYILDDSAENFKVKSIHGPYKSN